MGRSYSYYYEIQRIAKAEEERIGSLMETATRKTARECAKEINKAAQVFNADPQTTKVKYCKSWSVKNIGSHQWVVYSKVAGLPHLLENGHIIVTHGKARGSYSGKTHIAPVAEKYKAIYLARSKEAAGL